MTSTLVNRNVTVSGRRTSMRLEPELWDALAEIAAREDRTIHQICTLVDGRRSESTLTAAIRVFIVTYFRAIARESEADGAVELDPGSTTGRSDGPESTGDGGPCSKEPKRGALGSTPCAF